MNLENILETESKIYFSLNTNNQAIVDNRKIYNSINRSQLSCAGTPNEIKSVSVTLKALKDLRRLNVTIDDLVSVDNIIDSSAIDIRYVKWWYQGKSGKHVGVRYVGGRVYKPELLLKDNSLVKVDKFNKHNYVRSNDDNGSIRYLLASGENSKNLSNLKPLDTSTLQDINLSKGESQEYWINIHIPKDTKAGVYYGKLLFSSKKSLTSEIAIKLTVYPFSLEPSPLIYALYYASRIHKTEKVTTGTKWTYWKSKEQYRAEIFNMKEHGVLYPLNYQANNEKVKDILDIRKMANLPTDIFFNHDGYTGNPINEKDIDKLKNKVKAWITLLKSYGYKTIYFYGIDEAKGNLFTSQKKAWKILQNAGAKNFVATNSKSTKESIKSVGSLLDAAILHGKTDVRYARQWHNVGSKVFSYANPQVGEESPEIYRYNFGLGLWKAGYDGAMDFAYHYAFNHGWNDFDHPKYRDHMFVYPTINGVIDTIAWEGFREATYDVRYIATLQKAIKNTNNKDMANKAQRWLNNLNICKENLDETREKVIMWILKLSNGHKQ